MKLFRIIGASLFTLLSTIWIVQAASTGTIDPNANGSFKAKIENSDLGSANTINFGKFTHQSDRNIIVTDSELRGFAWGDGVGWIVTNCADTASGCSSTNSNFKIKNDGNGKLSGFAWGENTGWINFGPFSNTSTSTVKIENGKFGGTLGSAGYAWAQNFGWIKFDCSDPDSCVETDWSKSSGTTIGGGGSVNNPAPSAPEICHNTVNYDPVPLASNEFQSVAINSANKIGFAIKLFDRNNPANPKGFVATENSLNAGNLDMVLVYEASPNKYVVAFEDTRNGDNDFNDLMVEIEMSCSTAGACPIPSSLSKATLETLGNSPIGEKTIQQILNIQSYGLNYDTDRKQYQVWTAQNQTVNIKVRQIGKHSANKFVFGYYDESINNFVPIFKTSDLPGYQTPVSQMCIPDPVDACPNIAGEQKWVPSNKVLDSAGQCIDVVQDVCLNIAGSQLAVPTGYMYDLQSNCIPILNTIDICPNIAGIQENMPNEYVYDYAMQCVPKTQNDTCSTDPNKCTPPPEACSLNPESCTPDSDICALDPSSCLPTTAECLLNPSLCENAFPDEEFCETNPSLCVPSPEVCLSNPSACTNPPEGEFCKDNHSSCVPSPEICLSNPSLCTPSGNTCATNPSLCTPNTDFCSDHPEICYPKTDNVIANVLADKIVDMFGDFRSIISDELLSLKESVPVFFTSSMAGTGAAVTGLASTSLAGMTTFALVNPIGFLDIFLIISRAWSSILIFFGLRKKRDPWGTVYDSVTKQPIDPAYVVLYDLNGNEISTSITDIDGRYGFSVPAGIYTIVANKTNFEFPSLKLAGRIEDELYTDLYFGGPIIVNEDGGLIIKNIPLDQINFDWNEYAKTSQNRLKRDHRRQLWIARISRAIFAAGFIITAISFIVSQTLLNAILLGLYLLLSFVRVNNVFNTAKGAVIERGSKLPVPFSIVRVYSPATNREVLHKVTDKLGNYYALVADGEYKVSVDRKEADQTYTKIEVPELVKVKKGVMNKKIKI